MKVQKIALIAVLTAAAIVIGILETTISLGSGFFSLIGEIIINYDEEESGDDDLYNLDIARKIKIYLAVFRNIY